jgi:hypothetical protein
MGRVYLFMYGRHTGKVVADDGDEGKKVQAWLTRLFAWACVRACVQVNPLVYDDQPAPARAAEAASGADVEQVEDAAAAATSTGESREFKDLPISSRSLQGAAAAAAAAAACARRGHAQANHLSCVSCVVRALWACVRVVSCVCVCVVWAIVRVQMQGWRRAGGR